MSYDINIYCRAHGIATDENGNPSTAGMVVRVGTSDKPLEYSRVIEGVTPDLILGMMGVGDIIDAKDIEIISPEEYEREFGD